MSVTQLSISTGLNEDLIIRKLQQKQARQELAVAETKQHIEAMLQLKNQRIANEAKAKK